MSKHFAVSLNLVLANDDKRHLFATIFKRAFSKTNDLLDQELAMEGFGMNNPSFSNIEKKNKGPSAGRARDSPLALANCTPL